MEKCPVPIMHKNFAKSALSSFPSTPVYLLYKSPLYKEQHNKMVNQLQYLSKKKKVQTPQRAMY